MTEQSFDLVVKILSDRIKFYEECENYDMAGAYSTALDLFGYFIDDNIECLKQFDYFEKVD